MRGFDAIDVLPGGVMAAPENLDLVVKVRILAGQLDLVDSNLKGVWGKTSPKDTRIPSGGV